MNEQKCNWCGATVPRYKADVVFTSITSSETWKRAGKRSGSHFMAHRDPEGKFCTMRCAALWAIKRAEVKP